MVEQSYELDTLFGALSDPTRRDMLRRVSQSALNIGEIAKQYALSFAGVAKHVAVLEQAGLVHKMKKGKAQMVTIEPQAIAAASDYLETYRQLWEQRLNSLDAYLQATNKKG